MITKSKNIIIYQYMMNFKTIEEAKENFHNLANQLGETIQKITACFGQVIRNPKIYETLRAMGYSEEQIPQWYVRSKKKIVNEPPQTEKTDEAAPVTRQPHIEKIPETPQPLTETTRAVVQPPIAEKLLEMAYSGEKFLDSSYSYSSIKYQQERRVNDEFIRQQNERKEKHFREQNRREISQATDPFTFINACMKNPEWSTWYQRQSPQEKKETNQSMADAFNRVQMIRIQENQAQQCNQWLFARFMGFW